MIAARFPTSVLAAKILACTFHSMVAPGFDEALLAGVDLLGETLVRLGREELSLVFTSVSGSEHGDRVPLLIRDSHDGAASPAASGRPGAPLRVHELLHDLLAPPQLQDGTPNETLTYGGRMALGMASAVALVGGDGEELREVWYGFFDDVPQRAQILAALRALHGVPQSAPRHLGSQI